MVRPRRVFAQVIATAKKITHSPGWFIMGARYIWHGLRFVYDEMTHADPPALTPLSFYPRKPLPLYTIWGVCHTLGIPMRHGCEGQVMLFMDETHITDPLPKKAAAWINGRCRDIRKSTIERVYADVFNTPLAVDPLTYHGEVVVKSEENGMHDGKVITCPISKVSKEKVYQLAVDNHIEAGIIEDLRAVIVGTKIALVYRKRRSETDRFLNNQTDVVVTSATDVFSPSEIENILTFTQRIGLDFGELDILRDQKTNIIYIVDANNTSIYPPIGLSYEARKACIAQVAEVFKEVFLSPVSSSRHAATEPAHAHAVVTR